jgi:spore germination protein GerM
VYFQPANTLYLPSLANIPKNANMKYILNNFLYFKKSLPNAVSQSLSHFVNAKNMVKKFVGHHLHIVANQPIEGGKLSHALLEQLKKYSIEARLFGQYICYSSLFSFPL